LSGASFVIGSEQMKTRTPRRLHSSTMPRMPAKYFCLCSSSAFTP